MVLERSPMPGPLEDWLGEARAFPPDFEIPASRETGRLVSGFGGGGGGVARTPVVFVHGNTVSAGFWRPVRDYFLEKGYRPDELWALSYGFDTTRFFDANDLAVPTLDAFVESVFRYLNARGYPVRQVDIVAHSLGVTVVRKWLQQTNSYHRVRKFVAANGANHGVWTARADSWGENREVGWELYPGSPWLEQLNRGGETPGPTEYMTLYDGTGWADVLFPPWQKDSPALAGANNVPFNVLYGTWFDHLELPRTPGTMDLVLGFLGNDPPPARAAEAPALEQETRPDGISLVRAVPEGALAHCLTGGALPSRATPGQPAVWVQPGTVTTCFARDPRSGLSSPLERFLAPERRSYLAPPLELRAEPPSGIFDRPVWVRLEASDPRAMIVYSTADRVPDTGSALYSAPIFVPVSVTLRAFAVAPDGRRSELLSHRYEIDLSYQDARFTLERQLDPTRPLDHPWAERQSGP
jgi:pimeloyl-ACP methyl ester carboxylesterase